MVMTKSHVRYCLLTSFLICSPWIDIQSGASHVTVDIHHVASSVRLHLPHAVCLHPTGLCIHETPEVCSADAKSGKTVTSWLRFLWSSSVRHAISVIIEWQESRTAYFQILSNFLLRSCYNSKLYVLSYLQHHQIHKMFVCLNGLSQKIVWNLETRQSNLQKAGQNY
jgi:hypothetical protein